ncbi:MAG TPA: toll/interleukin-1 receptor domain-containing protein [Ktedonobacteraceae bacterium]|nr:toll/interleukin-1 receptor domain-containing protein [Ktedonobacteraceae bacterium]
MEPVQVFVCYAREDEILRDALEQHLGALKHSEHAVIWHDRKIQPGTNWAKEIDLHISTADIILLLVSSHFIASDYCYSVEMRKALEKHEARKTHVIPIILRPVDWRETPLGKLQALPKDGRPIVTWHTRDSALVDIVRGIRRVIAQIQTDDWKRSSASEFGQIVVEGAENHG